MCQEASGTPEDAEDVATMLRKLEEVREHITCCICLSIMGSPMMLACSHALCNFCTLQALEAGGGSSKCPLCKQAFTRRSIKPDRWLDRFVGCYLTCLAEFKLPLTQHSSPPPQYASRGRSTAAAMRRANAAAPSRWPDESDSPAPDCHRIVARPAAATTEAATRSPGAAHDVNAAAEGGLGVAQGAASKVQAGGTSLAAEAPAGRSNIAPVRAHRLRNTSVAGVLPGAAAAAADLNTTAVAKSAAVDVNQSSLGGAAAAVAGAPLSPLGRAAAYPLSRKWRQRDHSSGRDRSKRASNPAGLGPAEEWAEEWSPPSSPEQLHTAAAAPENSPAARKRRGVAAKPEPEAGGRSLAGKSAREEEEPQPQKQKLKRERTQQQPELWGLHARPDHRPSGEVCVFSVGDKVVVAHRTWKGQNKHGGVASVQAVRPGGSCDVKYMLESRRESAVEARFLSLYHLPAASEACGSGGRARRRSASADLRRPGRGSSGESGKQAAEIGRRQSVAASAGARAAADSSRKRPASSSQPPATKAVAAAAVDREAEAQMCAPVAADVAGKGKKRSYGGESVPATKREDCATQTGQAAAAGLQFGDVATKAPAASECDTSGSLGAAVEGKAAAATAAAAMEVEEEPETMPEEFAGAVALPNDVLQEQQAAAAVPSAAGNNEVKSGTRQAQDSCEDLSPGLLAAAAVVTSLTQAAPVDLGGESSDIERCSSSGTGSSGEGSGPAAAADEAAEVAARRGEARTSEKCARDPQQLVRRPTDNNLVPALAVEAPGRAEAASQASERSDENDREVMAVAVPVPVPEMGRFPLSSKPSGSQSVEAEPTPLEAHQPLAGAQSGEFDVSAAAPLPDLADLAVQAEGAGVAPALDATAPQRHQCGDQQGQESAAQPMEFSETPSSPRGPLLPSPLPTQQQACVFPELEPPTPLPSPPQMEEEVSTDVREASRGDDDDATNGGGEEPHNDGSDLGEATGDTNVDREEGLAHHDDGGGGLSSSREVSGGGGGGGPATPRFAPGDVVEVAARTWPGSNKPGGVARVTAVRPNGAVDVKYLVWGGAESSVSLSYVRVYPCEPLQAGASSSKGGESGGSSRRPARKTRAVPPPEVAVALACACHLDEALGETLNPDLVIDPDVGCSRDPTVKHNLKAGDRGAWSAGSDTDSDGLASPKQTSSRRRSSGGGSGGSADRQRRSRKAKEKSSAVSNGGDAAAAAAAAAAASSSPATSRPLRASSGRLAATAKKSESTSTTMAKETQAAPAAAARRAQAAPAVPVEAVEAVPVVLATGLDQEGKAHLQTMCRRGLCTAADVLDDAVTHVVAGAVHAAEHSATHSNNNTGTLSKRAAHAPTSGGRIAELRTLKYLWGVTGGRWVLSADWLGDSARAVSLAQEAPYELTGDRKSKVADAPRRARLARAAARPKLLAGVRCALVGRFRKEDGCPPRDELEALLAAAGARVERSVGELSAAALAGDCTERERDDASQSGASGPGGEARAGKQQLCVAVVAKPGSAEKAALRKADRELQGDPQAQAGESLRSGSSSEWCMVAVAWVLDSIGSYTVMDPADPEYRYDLP